MKTPLVLLFALFVLGTPVQAEDFGARFYSETPKALSDSKPVHPADIEPAAGEEKPEEKANERINNKKDQEKLDKKQ